jgi:hypothetical protein
MLHQYRSRCPSVSGMLAAVMRGAIVLFLGMGVGGCFEFSIPSEETATTRVDAAGYPTPGRQTGPNPPSRADHGSVGLLPVSDSGEDVQNNNKINLPESCQIHCECPAGYDCINTRCVLGDMPIYCCSADDCPQGEACWFEDGLSSACP